MNIEDIKKIAEEEMNKSIMGNLDSAIIFKYINNLENELKNKNTIIELMAQELINAPIRAFTGDAFRFTNKPDTIEYFTNKVEREGK